MKLVDTSVAIDHLRGDLRATELLDELIGAGELLVASELSRFEVLATVESGSSLGPETFFRALSFVPVDEQIARKAAEIRVADGPRAGLSPVDYLIAASALCLGADLLTTSVDRFPMIPGLRPAYGNGAGRE